MNPPVDLLLLDSLALSHGEVDCCELFQTSMVPGQYIGQQTPMIRPALGTPAGKVCFYSPTINRNHSGPTQLLRDSKPKRYFMRTYALAIAAAASAVARRSWPSICSEDPVAMARPLPECGVRHTPRSCVLDLPALDHNIRHGHTSCLGNLIGPSFRCA
jgi:hypothetical protein